MKALIKYLGLFLIFWINLNSAGAETVIVFISGDWDYLGAVADNSGQLDLKDQAEHSYKEWIKTADSDESRNYIIFYDPRGKGKIFNRKWVKTRVYRKGEKVYSLLGKREISSGQEAFAHLKNLADKYFGESYKQDKKVFFYYGEHFPARGKAMIDLGGSDEIGAIDIISGIKSLGERFDRIVFQTCYLNNLRFLAPASEVTRELVLPKLATLNHAIPPNLLLSNLTKEEMAQKLSSDKYRWVSYGAEVRQLNRLMRELEANTSITAFLKLQSVKDQNSFDEIVKERSPGAIYLSDNEYQLPVWDVLSIYDQYLLAGEEKLDEVEALMDQHPHLEETYDEL